MSTSRQESSIIEGSNAPSLNATEESIKPTVVGLTKKMPSVSSSKRHWDKRRNDSECLVITLVRQ